MGIGMVLIVEKNKVNPIVNYLEETGEKVYTIGEVITSNDLKNRVIIKE